jgi:hypothetical protein
MPAWKVVHEDPTLRIWAMRELLIAGWFNAPVAQQMRIVARAGKEIGHAYPTGAGLANVIVRGTPRFDDDVRQEGIRMAREQTFRRGSCHVVLVGGLAGAAARAFMSMVLLVGRKGVGDTASPAKVFGDIDAAARWFSPMLGQHWSIPEVVEVFAAMAAQNAPVTTVTP